MCPTSRRVLCKCARYVFFACVIHCTFAIRIQKTEANLDRAVHNTAVNYKTLELEVPVDHFSFANEDTFKLRYLVNDQFWDPNGGPVFFYTGNEGDITWFCNNTGFMWDIAPEFKAMLVFAEHRYYGTSVPYGKDSYNDLEHLGYLSSEQALADFVTLISHLRSTIPHLLHAPFIAFGGSYGGMLATWIRMKYPHAIQGSLAASAPIWYFGDLTPCDSFSRITTVDFTKASNSGACSKNIRNSWSVITEIGKTESGRSTLNSIFKLCNPLKTEEDVTVLKEWLAETYGNMAMVDYPYPASFLEPLPAWPIKEACRHLNSALTGEDLVRGVAGVVGVYYNFTGHTPCYNTKQQASASLGDMGWSFQACTEMVMPMCSNGETDMFEPSPWNLTAFSDQCFTQWGVRPRPQAALREYGGKNLETASNIIFSNGNLDPWSGAGVRETLSESLVAIMIEDGAHHLDLRSANPADPPSVKAAREKEKAIIRQWIAEHTAANKHKNEGSRMNTEVDLIIHHTTRGTHAAVFGALAFVAVAAAVLVLVKVRRAPLRVRVNNCSASPMWMEVGGANGNQDTPNENPQSSEKSPLLT